MIKNYFAVYEKLKFKTLLVLAIVLLFNCADAIAQCGNYQVYESIGTGLPTSGGTWAENSIIYGVGSARTGSYNLTFDASGDYIRTPQIVNPGVFSFWYRRQSTTSGTPQFTVETSPDNASWTYRGATAGLTTTYQQLSIDLGALGLTNVYVRIIDTRASGTAARYIDDIAWTSTAAGSNTFIPALANCTQTITCGTTYTFTDAGTTNDNYNYTVTGTLTATDYTITFTPSIGTSKVQMAFSAFDTQSGLDGMVIYNGPTTASPIFNSGLGVGANATNCPAGSYYGTTSPGTLVSTDTTGAITIRFRSDTTTAAAGLNPGWLASVTCITPCATPTAQPTALTFSSVTSTSLDGAFTAATTVPSGYLVVRSTSATAPTLTNGTTYAIGFTGLTPGTTYVVKGSAVTNTALTFSDSGLAGNTQYYYHVFSYNNSCNGEPYYYTTTPLSNSAITCPAVPNTVATASVSSTGFTLNWTAPTGGSASAITYTVQITTDAGYTTDIPGSPFSIAAPTVTKVVTGLTTNTLYYYRILASNGCSSAYVSSSVTTLAPPCTTPANQPTALNLSSITSTSLNGTFTAAASAPSGYLVVRSTSATAPTLTDGTTYAVGYTGLTPGTTYVIQGSAVTNNAVSFSDSGLAGNTQYYYYIYSYNNSCGGAPYYLTATTPLTNSAITCPAVPNTVATASVTSTGFTLNWTAPTGGSASAITYTVQVTTDAGYTANIAGSPFSIAAPTVTKVVTGLTASTTYYYRILASNGCSSAYVSSSVTTPVLSPTNNQCANATSLPCGTSNLAGTTVTAASYTHGSGCTMSNYGVWYTFTGDGNQNIISATTTSFDIEMAISSGTCGALTNITCQDVAFSSGTETYTLNTVLGTIYYVYIAHYDSASTTTGTFTISRTCITPPTNDQCSTATSLPCGTSNLAGYTNGALSYTHGTGCSMSNYGVWYTFTGDGNTNIISATTTNFDIEMAIANGSCGALTNITCQDNYSSSGTETYTLNTVLGTVYYVYIAYYGSGTTTGTFTISRTCVTPPVNNQCANATSLPCGTTNLAGTTIGAASYTHGTGCTMSDYGVWYTFTGDGNQSIISATTTNFDIEMSISSGSCGALTNIACRDNSLSNGTETYTFNTVLGTVYYVYIAYYASGIATGSFTISRTCIAPVTNDECSGAIPLTLTTTCNYTSYSNIGASASSGIPAPGCASYSTGDVWFTATVPASGELSVDLQSGTITDSGMAFYSGTCGSLTLMECDDDDSNNGAMSNISMTGLTPGQIIYIRVWDFSDSTGTFGICATTPSCPSPSDLYATVLSSTSVTVNWNASVPPASGGYQYYFSTSPTTPTSGTTPTGSTSPGVLSVTLTGLTAGQNYYFWVRSFCGGTDTSTWFGPTNFTPCAAGNGTGTTTLKCPSVLTGGVGLNGANPPAVSCSSSTCTNLQASYLQLNAPTNYTVSSIPYTPPYQFTCLQNPVSVNVDDIWSSTINLPFDFCFYGNNYNKCLIGSNGVITFDTTTYSPGGYSTWSFTNNLPNTSLFRNSIFGVYHDIDPSEGGQIGYQLITLNTGCRALVASWNDIPMYSSTCNSQLYTGMIVLYENTNIIDVYIKEKNVCGTWNDGNAIVGLQNAAGSAAVVAPNRNGLDTNWTATNEAWRFTPSGSSITSIQWYEGNVATGTPISGATNTTVADLTTSTINVCPTVSTTYTAEITYALCNGNLKVSDNATISVTGNKIWNGSQNTTAWNDGLNWTPNGIPTNTDCIIVPQVTNNFYPVISAAPDGVGYNLNVYNNASLTINPSQNLTITDKVTVQTGGIFTINNSASLIQINNILNSGNITYNRISPNIRTLDYVYWSSPVANFNVSNIVLPYTFGMIYKWNTTVVNPNTSQGNWQNAAGNIMVPAKGYIARSPGTSPFNNTTYNPLSGSFTGVPNNGNITIPIERGTDQILTYHTATNLVEITNLSDNWNLLGNPYPSAIRGSQFLFDNRTILEGNIRLWTHGNLPVYTTNPFYSSFVYNYTSGDYLTYNFTGTSCCPTADADLFIGAGQGFFVQMIDGPPVSAADNITVAFNNNLRNASFANNIFYKTSNYSTTSTLDVDIVNLERNRIWLDIVNSNNQTDRTLFGYIENATMEKDSFYDCVTQNTGGTLIYSLIDDTKFSIQGRALPFDVNDQVPIGINIPTQGNYKIAIGGVDGLFNTQNIYLVDNLLNITYDIKVSPYQFTASPGMINDRFKIVYINNALGNPDHSFENNIKVMVNNEVAVSSNNLQMESIVVYNVLGQKLNTYKNVNSNYIILSGLHKNNTTLLLKIKLQTGETVIKKISY